MCVCVHARVCVVYQLKRTSTSDQCSPILLNQPVLQRQRKEHPEQPLNSCISKALGAVAPSITLTALSESAAFLLGAISNMPAVRTFSLFAGTAVLLNFLFQVRRGEGGEGRGEGRKGREGRGTIVLCSCTVPCSDFSVHQCPQVGPVDASGGCG